MQLHEVNRDTSLLKRRGRQRSSPYMASYHRNSDMKEVKSSDKSKKRQLLDTEAQNSLKDEVKVERVFTKISQPMLEIEEILHLQKQLEEQFLMRYALEKALSHRNLSHDFTYESTISKPAKDLIREIDVLELEVKYLEKYLLTMYRKIFGKRLSSLSSMEEGQERYPLTEEWISSEIRRPDITSMKANSVTKSSHFVPPQDSSRNPPNEGDDILGADTLINYGVHRSQSSLSQRSACAFKSSPPLGTLAEAVHSYQSLPLSMLERAEGTSSNLSLAEHLSNKVHDRVQESPNLLSEEMIKCISAIYCQLADPPLLNHGFLSSPISISSSMSELSPRAQHDIWGLQCGEDSCSNSWFNNHFNVQPSGEVGGSFFALAEVHGIRRDNQSLHNVEHMLENFRYLVSRLEEVEIRKLKHDQKLAFWINVHNALVMHALLVYGIPQSNLKRFSLILKAAYNVGGYTISIDMIQSSILGCRLPRPGQWLQSLFFPRAKYKAGAYLKAFAIEHPEPRLYFALCSGSTSDPTVRLYTSKSVFQELEVAKEEYIQTNIRLHKEQKLILPKIVDSFVKELNLCSTGLADMIEHYLPDYQRKKSQQPQKGMLWKKVVWNPHNFTFRFQISNELTPC